MDEKRNQVFVSSTFDDLKVERQEVLRSLLKLNCFPAGMELFPAADEEQMHFIKNVINECDLYLVIVGARYGSEFGDSGISFTEAEYDYARERRIPVLAFLHREPNRLPDEKRERDPEKMVRLTRFRAKLQDARIVSYWESPDQLAQEVILALVDARDRYETRGWVRGGDPGPSELMERLERVRKENEDLRHKLEVFDGELQDWRSSLAEGNSEVALRGNTYSETLVGMIAAGLGGASGATAAGRWELRTTWNTILAGIGPDMLEAKYESTLKSLLARWAGRKLNLEYKEIEIDHEDFNSVKVQFLALGFLGWEEYEVKPGMKGKLWLLTERGRQRMLEIRATAARPAVAPVGVSAIADRSGKETE